MHGATRTEQQKIALSNARAKITAFYENPPQLDPKFRPIMEIPLADRLRLPLQAAEHWISLIHHQAKVTAHNLKVLLHSHILVPLHFRQMQKIARIQRFERRQPDTPRKAHRRAIQAANRQMREKLCAPKATTVRIKAQNARTRQRQGAGGEGLTISVRRSLEIDTRPSPQLHPP